MRKAILLGALLACGDADVSRLLGAQCDVTAECDDRCLAPSPAYPDGFCTLDCSGNAECPEDSDCVDLEGGVCLFTCNVAEDCLFLGPTWTCREETRREDPDARSKICVGT